MKHRSVSKWTASQVSKTECAATVSCKSLSNEKLTMHSAGQTIPRLLSAVALPWSQNLPPETVLNRRKPVHTFITCFFTVSFNIILLTFQTKISYIFLTSAMPVTCREHPVLLYFIALILF